jgi:hypothetical protein
MFTVVLIKNQAFWERVFLLTERQVLDVYENPLTLEAPVVLHYLKAPTAVKLNDVWFIAF